MKFQLTKAAIMHMLISFAAGILLVLAASLHPPFFSPLLYFIGAVIYGSREFRDLQKSHKWNLKTWNSAEFIMPLIASVAMFIGDITS